MKQPFDQQMITDYLLGNLPEDETERLDRMSLVDEEFAGQVDALENDLVDSFVRGELAKDLLARFESYYLASPRRLEKVAFAKTFINTLDKSSVPHVPVTTVQSDSRKSQFFFAFRQWGFAAAALLLLVTACYLLFENNRLRNQVSQSQMEMQQQLAAQQSSSKQKDVELANVRKNLAELQHPSETSQKQRQSNAILLAFHLSPQNRGISELPLLELSAGIQTIAFTLELEMNEFADYQVALKNPVSSQIIWKSVAIKPATDHLVHFNLPANLFENQNYVLQLSAITAEKQSELISNYPFRVIKQ